jgi:hypothetical protein
LFRAEAELLCRSALMAGFAKAADVAVVVASALAEWDDVVGHGCRRHKSALNAIPAERFIP